jgi:arylsulfatase A-like enzyme
VIPPKGAPNVLLITTDDAGYGISSTFGGVIPTPALDRIAQMGLRNTQFHSTALCSPTRTALVTGRNHHSVGFGVVTEQSTGFPGYLPPVCPGLPMTTRTHSGRPIYPSTASLRPR